MSTVCAGDSVGAKWGRGGRRHGGRTESNRGWRRSTGPRSPHNGGEEWGRPDGPALARLDTARARLKQGNAALGAPDGAVSASRPHRQEDQLSSSTRPPPAWQPRRRSRPNGYLGQQPAGPAEHVTPREPARRPRSRCCLSSTSNQPQPAAYRVDARPTARHRAADRRERRAGAGRQARGHADRAGHPARRGPPAGRGRARRRQDVAGQGARPVHRLHGQPHAVHPGPAAQRRHRRLDLQPADQRLRVPARPGVRQHRGRRRDQPRLPEDAVGAAGVHGGAPGHRRRHRPTRSARRSWSSPPRTRSRWRAPTRCPRRSATGSPRASRSATPTRRPSWPWSTSTPAATRWTSCSRCPTASRCSGWSTAVRGVHMAPEVAPLRRRARLGHPAAARDPARRVAALDAAPGAARRGRRRRLSGRDFVVPGRPAHGRRPGAGAPPGAHRRGAGRAPLARRR